MGTLLGRLFPRKRIELKELKGKVLAADALNFMYQFLASIRQKDGTPLVDSKGRITSHLSGFFYRTIALLEEGIKPVYVFDGEPPKFKQLALEKRKIAKEEAEKRLKEAIERGNSEEVLKYAKRTVRVLDYMINDARRLLEYMGIPCVQAPSEAEAQAACMAQEGTAWAAASSDYDSLLFGSPRLVRGLAKTSEEPELLELEQVLQELRLSRKQLIVAGILAGCDYTPEGFEGIGPKTALEIARKYRFEQDEDYEKVEKLVRWNYPYRLKEVVEFYLSPPVLRGVKLEFKKPQPEKIVEFLCEEHDFSRERVERALERLERAHAAAFGQSSLLDFF
ncbi:MAG: flap endonuclease-1 [bacterium]|nr:flap endonuclease-1 [bacterium]